MLLLFFLCESCCREKKTIPCYLLNPLGEGNGNRRRKYPKERVAFIVEKKKSISIDWMDLTRCIFTLNPLFWDAQNSLQFFASQGWCSGFLVIV